jgi:hypothetical protein
LPTNSLAHTPARYILSTKNMLVMPSVMVLLFRVAPTRPAHSMCDDPQANSPPGGMFARRRTGSNAAGR